MALQDSERNTSRELATAWTAIVTIADTHESIVAASDLLQPIPVFHVLVSSKLLAHLTAATAAS